MIATIVFLVDPSWFHGAAEVRWSEPTFRNFVAFALLALLASSLRWSAVVSGGGALSAVPADVLARIGSSPRDLSRLGSSRVLAGNNLILKVGPPDRADREAFVLDQLGHSLRLAVPSLIDAGSGWLLLRAIDVVEPSDPARWSARVLADLAGLHEAFAGTACPEDTRLRGITGRELPVLARRCAVLAARLDLPEPLGVLAVDLEPLLGELRGEMTFVHGDAWRGNVLSTRAGGRCWIDWEEAGTGHPALDLDRKSVV